MKKIRIGTRGSQLALKQASLVQEALAQADSGVETEIIVIHTKGDKIQDRPLHEIGDKGVFASELEQALKDGQIDLAVHSAKDLPMELAEGLTICAVLPRADVRDVLVVPKSGRIPLPAEQGVRTEDVFGKGAEAAEREAGAAGTFVIGTGSRRRRQQAGQIWANVVCENIRGNVDTRLRKLKDNSGKTTGGIVYDGIILAKAGLDRLGAMERYRDEFDFYPLAPEHFLPAACQGILAAEAVRGSEAAMMCANITDPETALCFLVERGVLSALAADCSEAAAAWCRRTGDGPGQNMAADGAPADGLVLDVMYAGRRAKISGGTNKERGGGLAADVLCHGEMLKEPGQLREGLAMARRAAAMVKGESGGKVYLAGGGCGDAGLLTLKAWEVLRDCDVVVYDSLVSEELLRFCKPDCERIYVGKRYGRHARKQEEINLLLIEKAREGNTVARLKGGDPYVFGRGGEEFLAVTEAGIACEEIPGISSAIAVPAAAGIPVTHRGLAAGVTVVTGTAAEEDGQARLKLDFDTLARLEGTLVVLMGMHHLEEITEGLLAAGKDPDTPCAVIMEGTTRRQRCMRTVLSRLYEEAAEQGFTAPAVIVVGAVAELALLGPKSDEWEEAGRMSGSRTGEGLEDGFHAAFGENSTKPGRALSGVSVGITGTAHFVQKMSAALIEKGADVWDMGFMEIRPGREPLPDLSDCGWLVFTSPNGVRVFLDKMRQERKDLRTLSEKRIAVIGPGTAEVFAEAGIYADYMPEMYDVAHLAKGLTERILAGQREGRIDKIPAAFLRAGQGSASLPHIFEEKGISFLDYPLYELAVLEQKRAASVGMEPDYLVFGSALGVRAYFEGIRQAGGTNEKSRFVCIGEGCGEELKKHTQRSFLTARESHVKAIVKCVEEDIKMT